MRDTARRVRDAGRSADSQSGPGNTETGEQLSTARGRPEGQHRRGGRGRFFGR